jgi:ribosomal-protein-alanine N-acetyltransferase
MSLETQRCKLVACELEHIPLIIGMFREPDSNKYIQPLRDADEAFWLEKLTTNIKKNQDFLQYWCAFHKENEEFIGTLNLNEFADTGMEQIGVHLRRKYWGRGYGFELCQTIIDYGRKVRKLPDLH